MCLFFICCSASPAFAQSPAARVDGSSDEALPATASTGGDADTSEMDEVRRQLREQRDEIERLRAELVEQMRLISELRDARGEGHERVTLSPTNTAQPVSLATARTTVARQTPPQSNAPNDPKKTQVEERIAGVEAQAKRTSEAVTKQLGSISFSGDIRLRYESFYGLLNAQPNAANPSIVGNELSPRHRGRVRARLAVRGQINKEFEWGLRLATGSFADDISSNQTLTDFYNRKPFTVDQAFVTYRPARVSGLRLQGGKFETPWLSTEMTFDQDLQMEGINESYSRDFKNSALENLTFVAWQLPFLERNSAFVRNPNGTVNVEQSRRGGRDLALYGAQLQARLQPAAKTALTLSAANHYFSGTQFITPIQFFGNQLQLPVTVTIPATATTPAQTLTGQATIARDLLVSGNGNLGLTTATNNAVNADGRLASGFNLVDLLGRIELTHSARFPVTLLFNFVTNTQARDVVATGAGGSTVRFANHENNGYWAEIQAGKTRERGDFLLGYTLMRIEKDAVLTPFNISDVGQQSDMRVQRFAFAYAADPRVTLSLTGIVTSLPNGLRGVFGATPPGSLDRPNTRLQMDTIFRF
ncbi:MAG TPA: putative porin [Pyrinomonadaceae bacterium]|nr:putative porin [Pyrinomonadaceae bacterium]